MYDTLEYRKDLKPALSSPEMVVELSYPQATHFSRGKGLGASGTVGHSEQFSPSASLRGSLFQFVCWLRFASECGIL